MSPLLFAAALTLSSPTPDASAPSPILKDLPSAPAETPLDAPAKPPLLRDLPLPPAQKLLDTPAKPPLLKYLRGSTQNPADGSVRTLVLPPGALPPPGSISQMERDRLAFAGKLCVKPPVKTSGPGNSKVQKLADLPPGLLEHAVNRLVNGCPVREIVSGGGVYYLDAPTGGLERADPVAYATKPLNEGH